MARITGRNARVYVAIASGGTAEPITFVKAFNINRSTDRIDVTAFGDRNKVKLQGLSDADGDASGYYDSATAQFYTAALDGVARPTYFYEDITQAGAHYDFGLAFWDMSKEFAVEAAGEVTATWAAAGEFSRVG